MAAFVLGIANSKLFALVRVENQIVIVSYLLAFDLI
jgi:hypothetical protein